MTVEAAREGLPEDLASAHQLITKLQQENAWLRHRVDLLCRRVFGKSSEKVSPDQLALAIEMVGEESEPEAASQESDSVESPSGERKKRTGRKPLPDHLRRERVVLDLPEAEKTCTGCQCAKEKIGEEVSEKLDFVPSSLFVRQTVVLKYACPRCHDGVKAAPAPAQAVEKGLATEGLLAQVVTAKYADHLPLYRLERIFGRQAVSISRATMCGWVRDVADALSPIYEHLKRTIITRDYLQTDDTTVMVLVYGSGGSFTGRLWVYLDPLGGEVVFDATPTRGREGPAAFLEGFAGHLQADAYAGYDALYRKARIVEVGCWAHARRKFFDAQEADPKATLMVDLIGELYKVERQAESLSAPGRRALREERSVAVLEKIDELRATLGRSALPRSGLGEALGYLHNQREALGRFLQDGRLKIDNNGAENQLRVVAVGRKNWLFAGSMEGARRAAVLYTLVQGCRLAKLDPFVYLRDVLLRVASHPASRIQELTPKGWATHIAPSLA